MKIDEIFCNTFKALRKTIEPEVNRKIDFIMPSMPMVNACRADDFAFFQPWIEIGKMTAEQMHHAAERYYLGKSKSGQPIFWLIDDMHIPQDGLIYPNTWISTLLKQREPLLASWQVHHCLFGLHLAAAEPANAPISIVESPISAIVLSELFPTHLWLSTMPCSNFTINQLKPLRGRKITVYPDTDETLSNYVAWLEIREMARKTYHLDFSVNRYLEDIKNLYSQLNL